MSLQDKLEEFYMLDRAEALVWMLSLSIEKRRRDLLYQRLDASLSIASKKSNKVLTREDVLNG